MPEFVHVLAQARKWGVAPWDLVAPESKGMPHWLVWMSWAEQLVAHQAKVLSAKTKRDAEIAAYRKAQAR